MRKIGVDTFIWSERFVEDDLWILDKAAELGFEPLDIAIAHPEEFPTAKVKARAADLGLPLVTTTTLGAETNPISPDAAVRANAVEHLKRMVDICNELAAPILAGVIYAGWGCLSGKPPTEDEWNWSVEVMQEACTYGKETGDVTFAVEPVNRFETHFLNTAETGVRYARAVGTGNIGVHLDTFHMIREEANYTEAVNTCGKEYLAYVHACESNRGIPGTGLVPWKEFFGALDAIGYEGAVVIGSFDPGFEELSRLCAIWRKFADSGEELAVAGKANLEKVLA